jgi:hypothetical protein
MPVLGKAKGLNVAVRAALCVSKLRRKSGRGEGVKWAKRAQIDYEN